MYRMVLLAGAMSLAIGCVEGAPADLATSRHDLSASQCGDLARNHDALVARKATELDDVTASSPDPCNGGALAPIVTYRAADGSYRREVGDTITGLNYHPNYVATQYAYCRNGVVVEGDGVQGIPVVLITGLNVGPVFVCPDHGPDTGRD